jgi:hypothetical protein
LDVADIISGVVLMDSARRSWTDNDPYELCSSNVSHKSFQNSHWKLQVWLAMILIPLKTWNFVNRKSISHLVQRSSGYQGLESKSQNNWGRRSVLSLFAHFWYG